GVDKSKFIGEITFNPVINTVGFWQINLDSAIFNGNLSFSGKTAIIDTGTTTLFMPSDDAAAINNQIPGSVFDKENKVYIVPCDSTSTLYLRFGGVDYTIPSDDLIFEQSSSICISAIIPNDLDSFPNNLWIVGQPFLKNVYSVYDVKNRQVGFAH
ncbi:23922_t:CDS:1, partial [Racocetra persica]